MRAAVRSAIRAGLHVPVAADLFGDADLRSRAGRFEKLDGSYTSLVSIAQQIDTAHECDGWIYTGALENHPELIDAVPVPLWGNDAAVIRAARDPRRLSRELPGRFPQVAWHAGEVPAAGDWLRKLSASASGLHVWPSDAADDGVGVSNAGQGYWQRRLDGEAQGAVFVAAQGQARLLGVTRQWFGPRAGAPRPYQYAGSVGPLRLSVRQLRQWQSLGDCCAGRFGLVGLFGIDAIDTGEQIILLEINPRYTASVEVLEQAGMPPALAWHLSACRDGQLPPPATIWSAPAAVAGKRVVYAPQPFACQTPFLEWAQAQGNGPWPRVADIPAAPCELPAGAPIVTVLAGPSRCVNDVQQQLSADATEVLRLGGIEIG